MPQAPKPPSPGSLAPRRDPASVNGGAGALLLPDRGVRGDKAEPFPPGRGAPHGRNQPTPRRSCAVSNIGSPTTLECEPERKRTKPSARPWME